MVTALIKLDGVTVGAVANRTALYDENGEAEKFDAVLTPAGCEKAADFVNSVMRSVSYYHHQCKGLQG